jgi:integrase
VPYIYKPHDIVRLLRAASELEPAGSIRPIMYTTLFGLIAATGIRIAEALALQLHDVTSEGLVVRESKYHKGRLLPVHATTRQALDRYLIARRRSPSRIVLSSYQLPASRCPMTPCAMSS